MQIIIPMAGTGERFIQAGYKEPKPLIEVDGKPIIEHVVNLFPGEDDFTFICNEHHLKFSNLRGVLVGIKPSARIISISQHKLGPVYSVLQASDYIDETKPAIVNYCDFHTYWDYSYFKNKMIELECDGCIACYKGFHPHLLLTNLYAGVRADKDNYMIEIREKHSFTENKMDTYQSAGTYYFRSGAIVKKYFNATIEKKIAYKGEYYVSMVYNLLKSDNLKTYIYDLVYFCQWGTPEDLEIYRFWSSYFAGKAGTS